MSRYKYCIVPKCMSSSIKNADKIFFDVPRNKVDRKRWCIAMKRDEVKNPPLAEKSVRHVCQDHFNVETDTENFMQYRLQGAKLRLKKGVLPHRFECQKPETTTPASERAAKRQRKQTVAELLQDVPPSSSGNDIEGVNALDAIIEDTTMLQQSSCDQAIQVDVKVSYRSKATSTSVATMDFGCTAKPKTQEAACATSSRQLSFSEEYSSSDCEGKETGNCFDYVCSETSDSDYEPLEDVVNEKSAMRNCIIKAMQKNTLMCFGISPNAPFLIEFFSKKCKCAELDVMITLKKIRQNETYENLAMLFAMSPSNVARIFKQTLPLLAGVLQNFIVWPSNSMELKLNLPAAFRKHFFKVQSIIDTFEIPIEKPSNSLHQSLTWSDYYKSNTVKYLISCTPDGTVSFISRGYGGRASDASIFEDSGYLNKLFPEMEVMADRGFKNIAYLIEQHHCKLVRPPSVTADQPMSADDVKITKRVAAVRVHVERVIGRLRHFSILSKHTCVDHKLVPLFDYALIVACGLINLQSKEFNT